MARVHFLKVPAIANPGWFYLIHPLVQIMIWFAQNKHDEPYDLNSKDVAGKYMRLHDANVSLSLHVDMMRGN
jgi:hypothetical protein